MLPLQARLLVLAAVARVPAEGAAVAFVLTTDLRSAGLLIALATFPQLLTGPLAGRALDRSGRPNRLIAGAIGLSVAALLALAGSRSTGPLAVAGAAALSCATPVLTGGLSSTISRWPAADHRLSAGDGIGYNVAGLAAPALVTVLAAVEPAAAWLGLAVATVPALAALAGGPALRSTGSSAHTAEAEPAGLGPAVRLMARSAPLRAVTVSTTLLSGALGGLEIAVAAGVRARGLAIERAGVLLTVVAVGGLIGSVAMARLGRTAEPARLAVGAIAATGAALLLMVAGPWPLMVAGAGLVGACDAPLLIGTYRTRGRHSPPGLRACVFTLGASLKLGLGSVGALACGVAIGARATTGGLAALGLVALAAALAGAALLRGSAAERPSGGTARRHPGTGRSRAAMVEDAGWPTTAGFSRGTPPPQRAADRAARAAAGARRRRSAPGGLR
jgi:hypothetical protein